MDGDVTKEQHNIFSILNYVSLQESFRESFFFHEHMTTFEFHDLIRLFL